MIDFGKLQDIDAAKILWGAPYAKRFEFQYWVGDVSDFQLTEDGEWRNFTNGSISGADGASVLVRLADASPVQTRYVRILLYDSSGTAPAGATVSTR